MSIFSLLTLPSISPSLHFLSPPSTVEPSFTSSCHQFYRLFPPPSAHSNPKLLKPSHRSRFGEALSVYDSDDEDELAKAAATEVVEGSNSSSSLANDDEGDDDDDDVPWFNDDVSLLNFM